VAVLACVASVADSFLDIKGTGPTATLIMANVMPFGVLSDSAGYEDLLLITELASA
jgi:hypothetical protein